MNLSVEQIRTLECIARVGSVSAAARELHRVPSAVLYQMRQLEDAVGVDVFDRSGYRTTLTGFGRQLLEQCAGLLTELERVSRFCEVARLGFEPTLAVVFDGLLPVGPLLEAISATALASPDTRVSLFSEYLSGVEERTLSVDADIALALVPFARAVGPSFSLAPVVSRLVASVTHELARSRSNAQLFEVLARHTLLTVRGSDPRLGLLPSGFVPAAELRLSDFAAKKEALLAGMGWGWMPEHLIEGELATGRLVQLSPAEGSMAGTVAGEHVFTPTLHLRRAGRASSAFLAALGIQEETAARSTTPPELGRAPERLVTTPERS